MRYVDNSLKLIACGSAGPGMPTYLDWDREVLEQCYDYVDGMSLHRISDNSRVDGRGFGAFSRHEFDDGPAYHEISRGSTIAQGRRNTSGCRSTNGMSGIASGAGDAVDGHKTSAPHLLEEIYNLEDALLVGGLLNTLIRNSNRVKIGCLAQLVNVIAPIMTNADGISCRRFFIRTAGRYSLRAGRRWM